MKIKRIVSDKEATMAEMKEHASLYDGKRWGGWEFKQNYALRFYGTYPSESKDVKPRFLWEIDLEEQVQGAGERVLPSWEARWGAQPGSLEQAGERLFPAGAVISVIQAHQSRDHPEPFVFLHLPAQPRLRPRRPVPAADQCVIFSRLVNAG